MPDADYLPKADTEFIVWLQNFTLKVTTVYNTTFGLTAAQLTSLQNDSAMASYLIGQYLEAFKTAQRDRTAYKELILGGRIGQVGGPVPSATVAVPPAPANVVAPGVKARVRALVRQLKVHPSYTRGIGQDLGIVAPHSSVPTTAKPRATALAKPGVQVVLTWTKGSFEGVLIESQRGAETEWARLDRDFKSPFVDSRPSLVAGVPEERRYRLWYLKDDETVGIPSDILTVSTLL